MISCSSGLSKCPYKTFSEYVRGRLRRCLTMSMLLASFLSHDKLSDGTRMATDNRCSCPVKHQLVLNPGNGVEGGFGREVPFQDCSS
jgi:hypothetical protein